MGEGGDMQHIACKGQSEIPRGKRFVHMQVNRVACEGGRCAPGITRRGRAGAKKVGGQGVSLCGDLNSNPATGIRVNIVPGAHIVCDYRTC